MENDRMIMRMAMFLAFAVLPSLASAQPAPSSQGKVPPDWYGKEVTQITVDGSSDQLKAFQEQLPDSLKKALVEQTIYQSLVPKSKLVYSYLTETEKKPEFNVTGFYWALKGATEMTKDAQKPMAMQTSITMILGCRPGSCAGQQAWKGPSVPPCDCL